jgi:hypothetical protein
MARAGRDRVPAPPAAPSAPEKGATDGGRAPQTIDQALREGQTTLDLSGLGLTVLPEALGQLTGLQELNLSANLLTVLQAWIGQLASLQVLRLVGNTCGWC